MRRRPAGPGTGGRRELRQRDYLGGNSFNIVRISLLLSLSLAFCVLRTVALRIDSPASSKCILRFGRFELMRG